MKALPKAWLAVIPWRERITTLANDLSARGEPWVAVADLHGHPAHLRALIAHLDQHHGDAYRIVTLGDYLDNGPDIPGLLDLLIELRSTRGERFISILGNHDLAGLKTLGWPGDDPDPGWYNNWRHYWDAGKGTPAAYEADSATDLAKKMPASHRGFLESLPWLYETPRCFFVHAGLEPGPIDPQRALLQAREMPGDRPENKKDHTAKYWLLSQLRDKAKVAVACDATWKKVVVSAHTKNPAKRAAAPQSNPPHFVGPNRICLSGDVDRRGPLAAVLIPDWEILTVNADGDAKTVPIVWPSCSRK
jgi:hypothetical protein